MKNLKQMPSHLCALGFLVTKKERLKNKNCKINYNYNKQLKNKHKDVKYDIKNTKCGREIKNVDILEYLHIS